MIILKGKLFVSVSVSVSPKLSLESLSADIVVYFMRNVELRDQFLEEISRVLKPGGTVLIQAPQPTTLSTDKYFSGYLELQVLDLKLLIPVENAQSVTVKASKFSWKIGSSFFLKKATPSLPKVQLDDDLVLIDGVKALCDVSSYVQLMTVELQAQRNPAKNCTCGRAEAEEKVVKLGLTKEQIGNPQSACGSYDCFVIGPFCYNIWLPIAFSCVNLCRKSLPIDMIPPRPFNSSLILHSHFLMGSSILFFQYNLHFLQRFS
ncbi:hypothetical protein MKW94_016543 [Papaver nudicaule]|uniref:Methyltransferase type 11 domain-containing protein n=1 Tax=Papaver nudicaule TaxID=74823 RepID=A0AA41SQF8_PAPNU|nr:hypothetical protein [Papaver nudicaule]